MNELSKGIAFLVTGAILGALASGIVQWKISQNEQETEMGNIAQALYFDISKEEDIFNYSLNHSSSKPNNIHVIGVQYYDNNGLYYVFAKDISKFGNEMSADLYDFYGFVMDIEKKQEDLNAITEKRLNSGNVSDYDFLNANGIMITLRAAMPDGIKRANKIKKELRQTYHISTIVPPAIIIYNPSQTYSLEGGSVEFTTTQFDQ